jgi:uncharacterized protein (DUF2236 family)
MLWTVAVIADSSEVLYETFVRRLSDAEKDALWRDYLRFGELFGMPRDAAPQSYAEFREYWDGMWSGGELHLTEDARAVAFAVAFEIPLPGYLRPQREVNNLVLLGTLTPELREFFGLRWSLPQQVACTALVRAVRAARPITPRSVRRGQNTASFELVAETEKRLVAAGKATLPTTATA